MEAQHSRSLNESSPNSNPDLWDISCLVVVVSELMVAASYSAWA